MRRTTEDDFFAQRESAYADAWEILNEGCDIPPSFEVFQYGLEFVRQRSRAPISVQQYARQLSDHYHRVDGLT